MSPLKLVIMCVGSLNLYLLHWHYQQWVAVKRRRGENISPGGRAWFNLFYTHKLFREVAALAGERGPRLNAGALATAYVLFQLLRGVTANFDLGVFGLLDVAAPFCLIPIQREINLQVREANPTADLNARFGPLNIVCLLLGAALLAQDVLGLLAPSPR